MDINTVKLLIWDLDETFWKGTLSEEDVCPISENIKIVKELVDRGIMNSIVSKNDPQKAIEVLKSWNIFDLFVFPRISWQPKGEIVYKLLNEMKLRAENVVFVDDNPSNIAEVEYYNKGICCIYPEELSELLSCPACKGKDDKQHLRLQQYHNLEKQMEARSLYTNNEDFLKSSHIKLQICSDCMSVEDRIIELVNRTNQLNYTKNRCSSNELHNILKDKSIESRYIIVKDDFGDYGIVGFYSLKNNHLIHFLFSCRTLGLGIEHYLYKQLGCPNIEIVGEVASPLYPLKSVTWIEQVEFDENNVSLNTNNHSMLFVGGCDLEQASLYLKSDFNIDTEFATVIDGNEIRTSDTCTLVNGLKLDEITLKDLSRNLPFIDYNISFGTQIFKKKYDVIVLSVVDDYIRGMYRHNKRGFYIGFGGYFDQKSAFSMYPTADFSFLEENFTFCGKEETDVFERNLKTIISNISKSTKILLINGVEIDVSDWIGSDRVNRNVEMNRVVDKVVLEYPNVSLVDMRKIVTSKEMFSLKDNRHFIRQVYYDLARTIVKVCESVLNDKCKIEMRNMSAMEKNNIKMKMITIKSFLKKCGIKNPLYIIKKEIYLLRFWLYRYKYSKIDYFKYEELVKMPDFDTIPTPYQDNISYGMYRPVKALYKGNVDIYNDYIEHGLCYAEAAPNLLRILGERKVGKIFTFSNRRKKQLEKLMNRAGYTNEVIPLGPIILGARNFYSKSELKNIKRKLGKTLLVFPMHSWPGVKNEFDEDELVMEIERLKPLFDTVLVCLYYMDIRNEKHKPFLDKGYTIVCNGSRFDYNFISRHRDIIELSDVTMSNGIGTHIGYSIALNRPHYYFKQNMHQKIEEAYSAESLEQEFRVGFEQEFVKMFGSFSFSITDSQIDFVRLYWGDF